MLRRSFNIQFRYYTQGPRHAYASLINVGRLRSDPYQQKTVDLLHNLHEELLRHPEPPKTKLFHQKQVIQLQQNNEEEIASPDFAWIKNEEKTFLRQIGEWFSNRKTANSTVLSQKGLKGLYMYGSVGTGKSMLSKFVLFMKSGSFL
jgi:predicted ATPase